MNGSAPVLLVEDDDEVAEVIVDGLASHDIPVDRAVNGEQGVKYLRTHEVPRMILLDWNMPVMNGRRMFEVLRTEPTWSAIPIVLLTADGGAKDKALEVRASGYVRKPFEMDDLVLMVEATLRDHPVPSVRRGPFKPLARPVSAEMAERRERIGFGNS